MAEKSLIIRIMADGNAARREIKQTKEEIDKLFAGHGTLGDIAGSAAKGFSAVNIALAKASPYIAALLTGAEKAIELAQFAEERGRNMQLVGSATMDALRKGTQGLVDDTTLAAVAVKGLQGDFKLSADEMRQVARAAVELHERGFGPTTQILQELTDSLRKGEVEGLKKYGIALDSIPGKLDKVRAGFQAVDKIANESAASMDKHGTATQRFVVDAKNTADGVKYYAGRAVEWTAEGLQTIDEWFMKSDDAIYKATGIGFEYDLQIQRIIEDTRKLVPATDALTVSLQGVGRAFQNAPQLIAAVWGGVKTLAKQAEEDAKRAETERKEREAAEKAERERQAREARRRREEEFKAREADLNRLMDLEMTRIRDVERYRAEQARNAAEAAERALSGMNATNPWATGPGKSAGNEESERVSELNREMDDYLDKTMQAEKHSAAFGQAGAEAFGLLISGADGAGTAFKDAVKSFLQGEAVRAAALALESAGLALFNLAIHDYPAAAAAGKAAVVFAGFAIGYGYAAHEAGPTSSQRASQERQSTSSPSPGRSTAGRSYAGSGSTTTEININIGSGFVGSPRELARELNKALSDGALRGWTAPVGAVRRA